MPNDEARTGVVGQCIRCGQSLTYDHVCHVTEERPPVTPQRRLIADLEALLAKTNAGEWDYNLTHLVMAKLPAILTALRAAEAFELIATYSTTEERDALAALHIALAALGEGPLSRKAGLCDTTMTERVAVSNCTCKTYPDNLGPCLSFSPDGKDGKCPYCDHLEACHPKHPLAKPLGEGPREGKSE